MDCRKLAFEPNSFDFIVDKTTPDALVCGDRAILNVARYLREVHRVLKTGCCYVLISLNSPDKRLPDLKRKHLNFEVTIESVKFGAKAVNYVYICRKIGETSEQDWQEAL